MYTRCNGSRVFLERDGIHPLCWVVCVGGLAGWLAGLAGSAWCRSNPKNQKETMVDSILLHHHDDDVDKQQPTTNNNNNNNNNDDCCCSVNSADAALFELLGVTDLTEEEEDGCRPPTITTVPELIDAFSVEMMAEIVQRHALPAASSTIDDTIMINTYFCVCPTELSIPAALLRRITEQVVWGTEDTTAAATSTIQRTYETIQVAVRKDNHATTIQHRRTLTRLEHLNGHPEWNALCTIHLRRIVSTLLRTPIQHVHLLKTKLNLKPPGGSGFAPHVDAPSLQVPFLADSNSNEDNSCPTQFVTVLVAIDDMTIANGCLRVALQQQDQDQQSYTIRPPTGDNPDTDGRAGAIDDTTTPPLEYTDMECPAGTCIVFGGLVPHRSSPNTTAGPRRAVFVTYVVTTSSSIDSTPTNEAPGETNYCCWWHDRYYARMQALRRPFQQQQEEVPTEIAALSTIPRI